MATRVVKGTEPPVLGRLIVAICAVWYACILRAEPQIAEIEKGKEAYSTVCLQCHASNRVMLQRKSADKWRLTVYSMIARGAQIVPEDIAPIVAYLEATRGALPLAEREDTTAVKLQQESKSSELGRGLLEERCVTCHELDTVLGSPREKEEWRTIIDRMKSYGVILNDEESNMLIGYVQKFD